MWNNPNATEVDRATNHENVAKACTCNRFESGAVDTRQDHASSRAHPARNPRTEREPRPAAMEGILTSMSSTAVSRRRHHWPVGSSFGAF